MNFKCLSSIIIIGCFNICFAQNQIEVADVTVKVLPGKEEVLYYAFAEGDKVVFNFQEKDNKKLAKIEIQEYPQNSRFADYESASIKDKIITVAKPTVYCFRFKNKAAFAKRLCKINIQRIPQSDFTKNFNTNVKWVDAYDTTYKLKKKVVITGYKKTDTQKSYRAQVSSEIVPVQIVDRIERVHSSTNLNGNVAFVNFQMPTYSYNYYESNEIVSWAYSLAVGDPGQEWYKDANNRAALRSGVELVVKAGLITSGSGALIALGIEGISQFSNPPKGDNVKFEIYQGQTLFQYGNSVAIAEKRTDALFGNFILKLKNDNIMNAINVDVKVLAFVKKTKYKDEYYVDSKSKPIKEVQTVKVPVKFKLKKVPTFN